MHPFTSQWRTLKLSRSFYHVEKVPSYRNYRLKIIINIVLATINGDYQEVDMLSDRGNVIQEYIRSIFINVFLEEPVITSTATGLIIEGLTLWRLQ